MTLVKGVNEEKRKEGRTAMSTRRGMERSGRVEGKVGEG